MLHNWPRPVEELVILGHSMGGLVARSACHLGRAAEHAWTKHLRKVVFLGTLRHGSLTTDPDDFVPLPEGVHCYAAAATRAERRSVVAERLLGDGLVPLDSALGRHPDPARTLALPKQRQWIGFGKGHLELLSRPEVYAQLSKWLGNHSQAGDTLPRLA